MKIIPNRTDKIPDEELIELVKNSDQVAFAELVDRYMKPVFQFSYSFIQNVEKSEDITQETFMLLWDKPQLWKPSGQLKSWLFRVARNKCIDLTRSQKPQIEIKMVDIQSDEISAEKNTFEQQMTQIIDRRMQDLPDRQREAIRLVHFMECTNIEAAEIMEISVDALESLLARGRRKLRTLLEGYEEYYFQRGEKRS